MLVVAPGGSLRPAISGAISLGAPGAPTLIRQMLEKLKAGSAERVAFAVPPGVIWTLSLYELAPLTALFARRASREVDLLLATAESQPLEVFGSGAGAMVRESSLKRRRFACAHRAWCTAEPQSAPGSSCPPARQLTRSWRCRASLGRTWTGCGATRTAF